MQETRLMENEYSVNLPTKFVYQGREWDGSDAAVFRKDETDNRKKLSVSPFFCILYLVI